MPCLPGYVEDEDGGCIPVTWHPPMTLPTEVVVTAPRPTPEENQRLFDAFPEIAPPAGVDPIHWLPQQDIDPATDTQVEEVYGPDPEDLQDAFVAPLPLPLPLPVPTMTVVGRIVSTVLPPIQALIGLLWPSPTADSDLGVQLEPLRPEPERLPDPAGLPDPIPELVVTAPRYRPPPVGDPFVLAPLVAPGLLPGRLDPITSPQPADDPGLAPESAPRLPPGDYPPGVAAPDAPLDPDTDDPEWPFKPPVRLPRPRFPFPEIGPEGPITSPFFDPFPLFAPTPTAAPAPVEIPVPFEFAPVPTPFSSPVETPIPVRLPAPVRTPVRLPTPGFVGNPLFGAMPGLTPFQGPALASPPADPCNCKGTKEQKKKRDRKDRAICYKGTYTEKARGLIKHRREQIPCQ